MRSRRREEEQREQEQEEQEEGGGADDGGDVSFCFYHRQAIGIRMLRSSDPDSTLSQKKLNAAVHRRQERARRCGHEQRAARAGPLDRWCAQP